MSCHVVALPPRIPLPVLLPLPPLPPLLLPLLLALIGRNWLRVGVRAGVMARGLITALDPWWLPRGATRAAKQGSHTRS